VHAPAPKPGHDAERGATFGEVFADREFRTLWFAQIFSVTGDRLALIALTILVYQRTQSPLLTASAYAAGFVPWIVGGVIFGRIADRLPRRELMIACDVIRMVLIAAMLIPGDPLPVLVALLFAATCCAPPFESARAAIIPDILPGDRYVVGTTVLQTTYRSAMVAGYAAGGLVVAATGARAALAADVATFAASAALVRYGLRPRPAAAQRQGTTSAAAQIASGFRLVMGNRRLRTLMLLGWLVAFYAVPEGVAAPYAHRNGGGPVTVGLVLAAGAFGAVLVAPFFSRMLRPQTRLRLMCPLAVCACALLTLCVIRPGIPVSLAIFAASGAAGVYQIAANTAFVTEVPADRRGQAFGVANAGLIALQGAAFVLAGAAAQAIGPALVIAAAGGLGTIAGTALTVAWRSETLAARSQASNSHPQLSLRKAGS
jgi:predicted MFS family arabinose efflux permease